MCNLMINFLSDECGATGIEYAVIAALVALVAIPAMSMLGGSMSQAFAEISAGLSPQGPKIRML